MVELILEIILEAIVISLFVDVLVWNVWFKMKYSKKQFWMFINCWLIMFIIMFAVYIILTGDDIEIIHEQNQNYKRPFIYIP